MTQRAAISKRLEKSADQNKKFVHIHGGMMNKPLLSRRATNAASQPYFNKATFRIPVPTVTLTETKGQTPDRATTASLWRLTETSSRPVVLA